jgi:hypothetical protein
MANTWTLLAVLLICVSILALYMWRRYRRAPFVERDTSLTYWREQPTDHSPQSKPFQHPNAQGRITTQEEHDML